MISFFKPVFPLVLSAFALAACAGERAVLRYGVNATPSSVAAQRAAIEKPAHPAAIVPVYVATNRAIEDNLAQPFGIRRSSHLNYARVSVGIPQHHKKGMVEKNGYKPNPAKHFTATSLDIYANRQAFKQALNTALAQQPAGQKEILLFIHGYNNNFAESTFRTAQFTYDYKLDTVTVHYAWPSGGSLGLYIYDRDSADFARDGLAEMLELLAETNAAQINVVAHSMGNFITMEALRTLALKNKNKTINRISNLLMAAPDIDVDVFKRQLKDIKHLPKSTAVQVSSNDHALTISGKITGGHPRIGDGSSIDFLRRNGITVIDMSHVDGGAHSVFASSPTLMALVQDGSLSRNTLAGDGQKPGDAILADSSSFIRGATSLILLTPARLLSSISQTR